MTLLEDQLGPAEGGPTASRLVSTRSRPGSGLPRPQQEEAEGHDDSRSPARWCHQSSFEVMVSRPRLPPTRVPGGNASRTRSIVVPICRIGWIHAGVAAIRCNHRDFRRPPLTRAIP